MVLIRKRFVEYLKSWKKTKADIDEEEYKISEGCCLFHNRAELSNFIDTNDDNQSTII